MLLAVDVGNTNIVIGVFSKSQLITSWRLATDSRRSADEYGILVEQMFRHEGIDPSDIDDVIISTVVPRCFLPYSTCAISICTYHHLLLRRV